MSQTLKVNSDGYTVLVPNPVPNQPPVSRFLARGEVYDFSDEEAARGRALFVLRHYASPAGPATVARREPALVEATEEDAEAQRRAEIDARTAELRDELARLEAERPPAAATFGAGFVAVTDTSATPEATPTPTQLGVRIIEPATSEPGQRRTRGTAPIPDGPVEDMTTAEITRLLGAQPERVDEVEAAEKARDDPRSTVLNAVAKVREKQGGATAIPADGEGSTGNDDEG